MGKPVAGDVVVLPFPHSNLQVGKRRPALVVADVLGDDLIVAQITSQFRPDPYSVVLTSGDFESGQPTVDSFVRAQRIFTIEQSVVLYVAAKVKVAKLAEVRTKLRQLFT